MLCSTYRTWSLPLSVLESNPVDVRGCGFPDIQTCVLVPFGSGGFNLKFVGRACYEVEDNKNFVIAKI